MSVTVLVDRFKLERLVRCESSSLLSFMDISTRTICLIAFNVLKHFSKNYKYSIYFDKERNSITKNDLMGLERWYSG